MQKMQTNAEKMKKKKCRKIRKIEGNGEKLTREMGQNVIKWKKEELWRK